MVNSSRVIYDDVKMIPIVVSIRHSLPALSSSPKRYLMSYLAMKCVRTVVAKRAKCLTPARLVPDTTAAADFRTVFCYGYQVAAT